VSARPGRILVEVPIPTPRAARTEADITLIKAEIGRHLSAATASGEL
jgi:hypothetical protein